MAAVPLGVPIAPIIAARARAAGISLLSSVGRYVASSAITYMAARRFKSYRKAKAMVRSNRSRTMTVYRPSFRRKELHYVMTAIGAHTVNASTTTGRVTCLNQVGEGSSYFERVGRQIRIQYIEFDIICLPPTNAGAVDAVTLILALDKNQNGTATAFSSFINTGEAILGQDFKNIASTGSRMRFLKVWKFNVARGPPDQTVRIHYVYKVPSRYALCQYTDDSATASYPATNGFNFISTGTSATNSGATTAQVEAAVRTAFINI